MKAAVMNSLFLLAIIFFLESTTYAITNGKEISESDSRAIVKLTLPNGTCTGVMVGSTTVLTAKHCTGTGDPSKILLNGVPCVNIKIPELDGSETSLDLALLQISSPAAAIMPILRSSLPLHPIEINIVGYGGAYLAQLPLKIDWSDTKRIGTNILQFDKRSRNDSYYNIEFDLGPFDENKVSGALPGDSGGPMLFDESVIGIASKSASGISNYTNLASKRSRYFLDQAAKDGWHIRWSE